jgi:hypothetical protein
MATRRAPHDVATERNNRVAAAFADGSASQRMTSPRFRSSSPGASECWHELRACSFPFVRRLIAGRASVLGATASACGACPPGHSALARTGRRSAPVLGRPRHQREDEHGAEHQRDHCDGVVHPARIARRDRPALNARSSGAYGTAGGPSRPAHHRSTDRPSPPPDSVTAQPTCCRSCRASGCAPAHGHCPASSPAARRWRHSRSASSSIRLRRV